MTPRLSIDMGTIGLGTFPLTGAFGPVDPDQAEATVLAHLQAGGRYVETAPSYRPMTPPLRNILASVSREDVFVATKCVAARDDMGAINLRGGREAVREQCFVELDRLGLDVLDLVQAHRAPHDTDPAETSAALNELRNEGLVRWVGVSNVTLSQLQAFERGGRVDVVQNRLSILHDGGHAEMAPHCQRRGIVFNPYQVLERGQLTVECRPLTARVLSDLRFTKPEYNDVAHDTIRAWFASHVMPLARAVSLSPEQVVVGWALRQSQVKCCVVGASAPAQAVRNAALRAGAPRPVVDQLAAARRELDRAVRDRYGVGLDVFRGLDQHSSREASG